MSSLEDAVTVVLERFGDERPSPSPLGAAVLVLPVTGDDEEDRDFRNMPSSSFFGRDQRRMVFSNIQSLVSRSELLTLIRAWIYEPLAVQLD